MTLENGIGGTSFVTAPAAAGSATSPGSMKHSLRSSVAAQVDLAETALLVKEEEKLMAGDDVAEDEEVTSEEEEPDNEATERAMLTVALVKSVVETRAANQLGVHLDGPSSPGSHAYGLRKRRRPSGQDLERLEHFQSTKDGGLARVAKMTETPCAVPTNLPAPPSPPPAQESQKKKFTESRSMSPPGPARPARPPNQVQASSSSVPNPLLNKLDSPTTVAASAAVTIESITPCPLPDQVTEGKLDPMAVVSDSHCLSTLATTETSDKRKVTINEPDLSTRRRGFSVDLDFFELGEHTFSGPTDGGGRDRTYSFECFAFGINADEPLPPLDQVSHGGLVLDHPGRPRGDSIIFDPSSFQDGGIHEQTALEKRVADAKEGISNTSRLATKVSLPPLDLRPVATPSASADHPVDAHSDRMATGSPTLLAVDAVGATTLSLDLLNKDGRIGIYLPEARRARIARFHAKRSRRIWRKRIKYDCRKKLADSRPRIKGRFVKRTEMDD